MSKLKIEELQQAEQVALHRVPALVTILIAGADNKIDAKEINWAEKAIFYRQISGDSDLFDYYQKVDELFGTQIKSILEFYPESTEKRGEGITDELAKINPILNKLLTRHSDALKDSWRSLAKRVAQASGGFLGYQSVSYEEEQLLNLDMLD